MAKIGKKLIEMLLFSMYPDPKIIYREYIQNSFDAISKAVKDGILEHTKDGLIDIKISSSSHSIVIRDNGCGIRRNEISSLLDIAQSNKDGISEAGLYGIGRLVGAGYCEKLIFRTTSVGEDIESIVIIDSNKARDIIADADNRSEAHEVMNIISSINEKPCDSIEHFFEVELFNVSSAYASDLLNEDTIIEYLRDVAPIDYSTVFKKTIIASSIETQPMYREFYTSIPYVTICVNNNSDIRKRYGLKIDGTAGKIGGEDDRILKLEYFTLSDDKFGILAKGWYAITKFSIAINESNKSRGMRLRMHNIQIGDSQYLDQFHKEKRGNTYFVGEIHTIHKNLRPTTDRSALAPTEEAKVLFRLIKNQFTSMYYLYSNANKAKSKVAEIHTKIVNLTSSHTDEENDSDINIIAKNYSDIDQPNPSIEKAPQTAMAIVLKAYRSAATQEIHSNSTISQKIQNRQIETNDVQLRPISEQRSIEPAAETAPALSSNPRAITDIFAPLKGKYRIEEIKLIRKCYLLFTKNCPMQFKQEMMGVWTNAIRDFEKDAR